MKLHEIMDLEEAVDREDLKKAMAQSEKKIANDKAWDKQLAKKRANKDYEKGSKK